MDGTVLAVSYNVGIGFAQKQPSKKLLKYWKFLLPLQASTANPAKLDSLALILLQLFEQT